MRELLQYNRATQKGFAVDSPKTSPSPRAIIFFLCPVSVKAWRCTFCAVEPAVSLGFASGSSELRNTFAGTRGWRPMVRF